MAEQELPKGRKAVWMKGAAFHEVAEALRVRTDQVVAATRNGDEWIVVWSETSADADINTPVNVSLLQRDPDDRVLRVMKTTQTGTLGDFIDALDPGAPG